MSGAKIKEIRISMNLSRDKFAQVVGYSPSFIYKIETGKRQPPIVLEKLLTLMSEKECV